MSGGASWVCCEIFYAKASWPCFDCSALVRLFTSERRAIYSGVVERVVVEGVEVVEVRVRGLEDCR